VDNKKLLHQFQLLVLEELHNWLKRKAFCLIPSCPHC